MIKMMRIDDRLLHGQVAFVWKNYLGVTRIIVANDELLHDPMQQVTMKMVIPDGVKLLIKSIAGAMEIINDTRAKNMDILVVVKNPIDAATLMRGIAQPTEVELLNIGNSGRINKENRKVLTKEVYVDEHEVKALQELLTYQIPFHIQMTPTSNKILVADTLNKFMKEE